MYKPKFTVPTERVFNPTEILGRNAPRVRVNMYASPEWEGKSPDQLQEAAQAIVRAYQAEINQLVHATRQTNDTGIAPSNYGRREMPGLNARMTKNPGGEILELDLFPNAAPSGVVPVKDKLIVPVAPIIKLVKEFDFWPVPGAQSLENPPKDWLGARTVNFFDPVFAPKNNANDPPPKAQGQGNGVGTILGTATTELSWLGDSSLTQNGFAESMWLTDKVGGTAIHDRPIDGKRYWEVHIKELNTGTPSPTTTDKGIDDDNPQGLYINSTTYDWLDSAGYTMNWPSELDNFLNPMIGLAPAYFLNTPLGENNFTHYILGLDTDMEQPRSIYCMRTKTMNGTYQDNYFRRGYYSVKNNTGADIQLLNYGLLGAGEEGFLAWLNPGYEPVPGEEPSGDVTTRVLRQVTGAGQWVYRQMLPNTGGLPANPGWYGPNPDQGMFGIGGWVATNGGQRYHSDTLSSKHHPVFPGSIGSWSVVGQVGGPYYGSYTQLYWVEPIEYAGTEIMRYEHELIDNPLENRIFGDFVWWENSPVESQVTVPWDADVGAHCPVLKGRPDMVRVLRDPSAAPFVDPGFSLTGSYVGGSEPPANGNNPNGNAMDTGTDLGELAVDDVIMIAADTDSRKVWFGKNGTWYPPVGGPDGSGTETVDWEELTGYTTLMDAASTNNPDAPDEVVTPEYYPAISHRLGDTNLEMHLGSSCTYAPPPGFKFVADDTVEIEYEKGFKTKD